MSRQRAMITFPFWFSSKTFSSSSCAVSWNSLHNSQDGLYLKYSRLDYFGHNSSRLLLCVIFLPLQLRDEDDAVFGMPILCRGRTVHFPESKKKKKKRWSDRCCWRKVYTHTHRHIKHRCCCIDTLFFFGTSTTENKTTRRPFFFRLIWSLMHENRDFYDQQLLKYMQNNLKNLERLQKLVLICSLCVCLGYSGTNESGTRSELT